MFKFITRNNCQGYKTFYFQRCFALLWRNAEAYIAHIALIFQILPSLKLSSSPGLKHWLLRYNKRVKDDRTWIHKDWDWFSKQVQLKNIFFKHYHFYRSPNHKMPAPRLHLTSPSVEVHSQQTTSSRLPSVIFFYLVKEQKLSDEL